MRAFLGGFPCSISFILVHVVVVFVFFATAKGARLRDMRQTSCLSLDFTM